MAIEKMQAHQDLRITSNDQRQRASPSGLGGAFAKRASSDAFDLDKFDMLLMEQSRDKHILRAKIQKEFQR